MSTVHPPDDVRILPKEAYTLATAGYEVVLIAHGELPEQSIITFRSLGKAPKSRLTRMAITPFRALRQALKENAAVYHLHDPELIPVGVVLRMMGKKVIFDSHEDLPKQIRSKPYLHPTAARLIAPFTSLLQRLAGQTMTALVAATPSIAENYPPRKTCLVQNFPLQSEFDSPASGSYQQRSPTVLYVGAVSRIRSALEMVQAMDFVDPSLQAHLQIIGRVEPQLREILPREAATRPVTLLGQKSRDELPSFFQSARLGLVLYHPCPNHTDAQPNKLFEYMAAGLPVIASDFPLWRKLVIGKNCGLVVDPQNPKQIGEAITHLLSHPEEAEQMGRNGRAVVLAQCSWEAEKGKLLSLYERLLPRQPVAAQNQP